MLELRLQGEGAARRAAPRRRRTASPVPLSAAQERLWFLDMFVAGSPVYHSRLAHWLSGRLDVDALNRSLDEVARRHEVLRTRFEDGGDGPVQVVDPEARLAVTVTHVSEVPEPLRETRALELARQAAVRPFDLRTGPPVRADLIRLGERDHLLVVTFHHIVVDGWSAGIFERELGTLYGAFAAGGRSPLAELPLTYLDYAAWQREQPPDPGLERRLDYWRARLADPPTLELAADRPRPRVPTLRAGLESRTLPADAASALRALARRARATPAMAILAALASLLARRTGQNDVMIGMAVANRDLAECEDLIGYLTNLLVLRTDVSGAPTFRELIGRLRETCLDAYANDIPFEKLVESLQPERKHSGNPLTDVQVSFVPPRAPMEMPGLACRQTGIEAPTHTGQPLTLYVTDDPNGPGTGTRLDLLYHSDLFTPAQMAALADQLVHLLAAATATPDTPVREISLVTPAARQVLPDLSAGLDRPGYEPVPDMFRGWAERAPGHLAIRHAGREMSYGELRERAETVAGHLLAGAARPGERVAVGGEPSPGLVAAFLGALMARAVVVPLDRRLPLQRQRQVLEISGAARLLWAGPASEAAPLLAELPDLAATCLEAATGRLPGAPAGGGATLPAVEPADPSYIYFTSGSTGVPKGVLGRHDTWSHLLTWQRERFRVGPGDRSAMTTRLSFDMVLRDLFLPLTSGAALCLPDEDLVLDVPRALRYLEEERVTVLHLVPALGQRWLDHRPGDVSLPDLRWTFFGGEPLPDALVRRWLAAFSGQRHRVVNFYGTTETMVRTALEVPRPPLPGIQPVGPPLPQTEAVVLGPAGEPAGIGELGEIFLRSRFCTYGYINAPEEQAVRFVPNRRRPEADDILYRTGDSGRHRPDGIVDVLGRSDDQVKIHGVRIDPAEVQAVLALHPDVAEAGIKVHRGEDGEPMLVAYYVPGGGDGVTGQRLRAWLAERLPEAMVPRAFTRLDRLPLLPNGKLDRRSLPEPELGVDVADDAPPRTDTERAVARIWGDVLGLPTVGLRSNFFALGGHSLKVVDLVSRIRETFAVDLPLRVAYESPTVEETARAIEQWQRDELAHATADLPEAGDEIDALLRALDALEGAGR